MLFSAFFVCTACLRRQSRRERCRCGRPQLLSLLSEPGRAFYRKAARSPAGYGANGRSSGWLGPRSNAPFAAALLLCVPVITRLLSEPGPGGPSLSLPQGLVLVGGLAALALGLLQRARPSIAPGSLRVDDAADQPGGTIQLRGRARLATTEIVSAVSGKPCLVFGVRGEVGNVGIDDADGGDFDLELPSGERVAISLEHAVLLPAEAESIHELGAPIDSVLVQLLEQRGIRHEGQRVRLAETMIQEGDEVVVEGQISDGGLVTTGYRGAKAVRVLGGAEGAPLRLRGLRSAGSDPNMRDSSHE